MIIAFIKAYILTLIIETVILNIFSRKSFLYTTLISILMNSLTLPFVWFVFPFLIHDKYVCTLLSEVFAYTVEAILLMILLLKNWKGIIIALVANLGSFFCGTIFY